MSITNLYSAIVTKSKVMYGRRLKEGDYAELMKKRSVSEVAAYLKHNTYYSSVLGEINEDTIHRSLLEKIIRKTLYVDYNSLLHFLSGNTKNYFELVTLKYEIAMIKLIVRFINSNQSAEFAPDVLYFKENFTHIDASALSKAKTFSELTDTLKTSPYHYVLKRFDVGGTLDIFGIETGLDMFYMTTVWKNIGRLLVSHDQKAVIASLGTETDILNIMAILRTKAYYDTIPEMIYGYVIPFYYRIKKPEINSLIEAKTLDECNSIVNKTKYKGIFSQTESKFWEQNYNKRIFELNQRALKNSESIISVLAYLHLKEIEIRNITSIIEGIRYNLEPEQIQKYVIGIK